MTEPSIENAQMVVAVLIRHFGKSPVHDVAYWNDRITVCLLDGDSGVVSRVHIKQSLKRGNFHIYQAGVSPSKEQYVDLITDIPRVVEDSLIDAIAKKGGA